jgi:hypothetical protein
VVDSLQSKFSSDMSCFIGYCNITKVKRRKRVEEKGKGKERKGRGREEEM